MSYAMPIWVAVFLGGGIGASLRYILSRAMAGSQTGFPYHTLVVNCIGCFAMGLVFALIAARGQPQPWVMAFIATGILGGFTTFSAFALDFHLLLQRGEIWGSIAYAALSVGLSLLLFFTPYFILSFQGK